tara:strand:- start:77485 stop:77757 length:273 start_codon:yes stop_codon:yes gene_type:complete
MQICKHCIVSGKVQGVFFRQTVQKRAKALGVTGWVRNLPNGTVETVICGEDDVVQTLCDWLWQGPDAAQVADIIIQEHDLEAHTDFTVRF